MLMDLISKGDLFMEGILPQNETPITPILTFFFFFFLNPY